MFIHNIDPVAFYLGTFPIRWYGLGYIASFLLARLLWKRLRTHVLEQHIDNILSYGVLAVVIGGRLGHVIFFEPMKYWYNPEDILKVWEGGMSFHGGFLGVLIFIFFYAKKYNISPWSILDDVALITPIGLGIGRVCNFINTELVGTITTLPWGVIFQGVDMEPRHPVSLYEAVLEGPILGGIVYAIGYRKYAHLLKVRSCLLAFFYALFRLSVEHLKIPKSDMVPYVLCVLMMVASIYVFIRCKHSLSSAAST